MGEFGVHGIGLVERSRKSGHMGNLFMGSKVVEVKLTSTTSTTWASTLGMGYVNIRVGLVETSRTSGDLGNLFTCSKVVKVKLTSTTSTTWASLGVMSA